MIFECERGRLKHREAFGNVPRGLDFDEVQLEIDDLRRMLNTPDHELKPKIYELLTFMERHKGRRRDNHFYHGRVGHQDQYRPSDYREQEIMKARMSAEMSAETARMWNMPTDFREAAGPEVIKRKPKPDSSGLLWLEEED